MANFVHPFMGLLSLLVFIIGIQLIPGKWLFLIAEYNTMTKEEKKHYNGATVGIHIFFLSLLYVFSLRFFLLLFSIISDKR